MPSSRVSGALNLAAAKFNSRWRDRELENGGSHERQTKTPLFSHHPVVTRSHHPIAPFDGCDGWRAGVSRFAYGQGHGLGGGRAWWGGRPRQDRRGPQPPPPPP